MMKVLLASASPRRKQLLQELGFPFEVVSLNCDEIYPSNLPVAEVAAYLSTLKAGNFRDLKEDEVLLTADTVVAIGNTVVGKPEDAVHATEMLQQLSGKKHQVYTAITLKTLTKTITLTDVAHIEMEILSAEEIKYYVDKYQPFDKAGSYGIQEWLGMTKIKSINGSYYTVMGLPTHLVYTQLNLLQSTI